MSLTFSQTQGNGSTLSYPIVAKGGYFEDDDITVELIAVGDGTIIKQALDTDYTIVDGAVIFTTAPTSDYYVRIRREVTLETTYSDFTRGNAFGSDNLNNSMLKALYQTQQLADGFRPDDHYWKSNTNAGNQKLINLADGENPGDAVNYGQVEELIAATAITSQYADEAAASASAASDSEDASAASETAASASEDAAALSATNAASSASSASTYASNASTSASNSATSASSASTSATSASSSATAAAASATAASTSATSASGSATNAATSASDASTSATSAATSATSASTSATAAAASAASVEDAVSDIALNTAHRNSTSNPHGVDADDIGYTASDVLTKLLTVDGPGSGLNADLVDGYSGIELLGLTDSNAGTSSDPNTFNAGYAISNHANTPYSAVSWMIHTVQSHTDTNIRFQIASRTDGVDRLFFRSYSSSWSTWVRLDNAIATVSSLGTRTTTGEWSITGLSTNVPLHIQCNSTSSSAEAPSVRYLVTSGASEGSTGGSTSTWSFSHDNDRFNATPHSCVIIPTSTTVIINVVSITPGLSLTAYQ